MLLFITLLKATNASAATQKSAHLELQYKLVLGMIMIIIIIIIIITLRVWA